MKLLIIFILSPLIVFSQEVYDEDSLLTELSIVDTSFYNGDKIYVFNDQSWEYASDYNIVEIVKTNYVDGCLKFDETDLYSKNWKNNKTFSIVHNLSGATDSIDIDLKGFVKPVSVECNSGFKIRWDRWHQGNDFATSKGTPIKAAWSGKVRYAKYNYGGFGNLVIIRHPNGLETYYAHCSELAVGVNDYVEAGQVISYVGNTGHSTGAHLHFEVRFMDNPIDPSLVMKGDRLTVCSSIFKSMPRTSKRLSLLELFEINRETEQVTNSVLQKTRTRRRRTSSNMD